MRSIAPNAVDQSVIIRIVDATDGTPEQAVEHTTSGITLWYRREGAAVVAITPVALAAANSAHDDGGIEHLDDGYYRLDLPDAACVAGVAGVFVGGAVTGMVVIGAYLHITSLQASADAIYVGTVTGATSTTTLIDSGLTQADNHWNGRVIIFITGTLRFQATNITDFVAATDQLVFTDLTAAPSGGDKYVVL